MTVAGTQQSFSNADRALLAICAAPEDDHRAHFSTLDQKAWAELAQLSGQTRTSGLVARSIDRCIGLDDVGSNAINTLGEQAQLDALTALAQGQVCAQEIEQLQQDGFAPIALKGLSLAFRYYPDPGLRPLRDLDLLLRPEDAVAVNLVLLNDPGFKQRGGVASYGLEYGHQLPEIEHIESGLVIELHHRINARGWKQEPQLVERLFANAEVLELLGRQVLVPSRHDNVLHLIEHATLHHMFANGPLILSDLHYLFDQNSLDMERLRCDAEGLGLGRSLTFLAHLADSLGAHWVPENWLGRADITPSMIEHACAAMLEPREITEQIAMLRRLSESGDGDASAAEAFMKVLLPSANQLSRLSGQPSDSPLRWLGYPAWLFEKGRRYLSAKRTPELAGQSLAREELSQWLKAG